MVAHSIHVLNTVYLVNRSVLGSFIYIIASGMASVNLTESSYHRQPRRHVCKSCGGSEVPCHLAKHQAAGKQTPRQGDMWCVADIRCNLHGVHDPSGLRDRLLRATIAWHP